jgi:hypothetical protein
VISLSRLIGSSIAFRLHLHTVKVFNFGCCIESENYVTIKLLNQHQRIIIAQNNNAARSQHCALRVLQNISLHICFSLRSKVVTQTFVLLAGEHKYADAVFVFYLTLYVSAVQISHNEVGNGYTKRVREESYTFRIFCESMSYLIMADLDSRNIP